MTRGRWRLRVARWLARSAGQEVALLAPPPTPRGDAGVADGVWREVCKEFGLRLLVLAEQLRPALDVLEEEEEGPDRLQRLYHVDHGVTRMRRLARDLRVVAGREGEEVGGHTSSLLDVIQVAASAIEQYERVAVGRVADLAVVAYAADDVASVLAALADNATRYSPSLVTISAHLLGDGGVMVRIEDSGLGIEPALLATVNRVLAGPVPRVESGMGRHTGFAVAHRLARKHGLWVQLARRQAPGPGAGRAVSGTIAMVRIPAPLLCEIPDRPPTTGHRPAADSGLTAASASPSVRVAQRAAPAPATPRAAGLSEGPAAEVTVNGLPRRRRGSIRTPTSSSPHTPELGPTPDPGAAGRSFADDVSAFTTADPSAARRGEADGGGEGSSEAEGPMP